MGGIKIVTDSASDLAPDLAERHGIAVVPLTIRFGDTEFLDRRDLTPDEFWSRCATSPVLPETAAPSPGAFQETFEQAAAEIGRASCRERGEISGGGGVLEVD